MHVRRVVTGTSPTGESVIVSDGEVEPVPVPTMPGGVFHRVWGSNEIVQLPSNGEHPEASVVFPPPGGFRFILFTHGPASSAQPDNFDPDAALAEVNNSLPGLEDVMESDGMHATDTVDIVYILAGEICREGR